MTQPADPIWRTNAGRTVTDPIWRTDAGRTVTDPTWRTDAGRTMLRHDLFPTINPISRDLEEPAVLDVRVD